MAQIKSRKNLIFKHFSYYYGKALMKKQNTKAYQASFTLQIVDINLEK